MIKPVQLSFILLITIIAACQAPEEQPNEQDRLLAKVYNKTLFASELEGMIPTGTKEKDSVMFVQTLVEKWVRESLLMNEAEHNMPSDLKIDELVRDYRASLIRHNYEKLLVELQLDSIVSQAELASYYENNKEQYQLEQPILRCKLIKVPQSAPELSELKEWWDSDDEDDYIKLVDYCSKYAQVYMLNDSSWYKLDVIAQQLPKGTLTNSNFKSKKNVELSDDDYQYFAKIIETVSAKKIAPLSFIEDQVSKLILHKRKIELIENKKEEMYERESMRNNVKIYLE